MYLQKRPKVIFTFIRDVDPPNTYDETSLFEFQREHCGHGM